MVEKIEGPFNDRGKLVEEIIVANTYIYKATQFSQSDYDPFEMINWVVEKDNSGKLEELPSSGLFREGNVICYKYSPQKAENIRMYAYCQNAAKKVSIDVPVVSFPILIARSGRRAGVCFGLNAKGIKINFTREDILNLAYQLPKDREALKQKLEAAFDSIGTAVNPKDKNSRLAYAIKYIEEYNNKTDEELFKIFRNDMDDWASGELDDNLHSMIDFFKTNKSTSNLYEDKRLTNAIAKHKRTKLFINGFSPLLKQAIESNKDSLRDLKVKDRSSHFIEKKYDKNPEILGIVGLQELKSLTYKDKISGLGISVDGTQAFNIYLTDISFKRDSYHGKMQLEILDHFGLDPADILKDYIRKQEEFICWFILQHIRSYKPFITHILLNYKFAGKTTTNTLNIVRDGNN